MMKKTITHVFSKKRLNVFLLTAFLMLGALPFQAGAFQTKVGEVDITFDSTFAIGGSIRVEDINYDLVGKCNQKKYENDPTTTADDGAFIADLEDTVYVTPKGAWNSNSDDGDLNFDPGFFSQTVSGIHELDIRYGNYGFFTRANWFYDHYLMQESEDMRWDIMENDDIKDNHGRDIDFLDYFFYSTFNVGNFPVAFRLGSQVINWGEASFMPHSMNVSNPLDAAKYRVPGAEIKDALVPQGTVYASVGLTNSLSFETYYQYEWEATTPDSPGTYFSTSDAAGPGGEYVQLSFAQVVDYHGNDMNSLQNSILKPEYFTVKRTADDDAKDSGQFGVKFGWYAEMLNETEFNFYFANYHSKNPMLNMRILDHKGYTDLHPEYYFTYPEDIKLYGMSFNTLLPWGVACGGEVAYRQDEPYAIDGTEVSYKMLEPLLPGVSQINGAVDSHTYLPGDEFDGYIRLDSINFDLNFTKIFFNFAGFDEIVVLTEFGCTKIKNMPDPEKLRLETPGTDRSGNPARAWADPNVDESNFGIGQGSGRKEGVQSQNDFADDLSYGYVFLTRGSINDAFMGVNLHPLIVFKHDVEGTAPSSAGTFIQGRKQLDLKLGFDWHQNWSFDLGYTMFMDGGGTTGTANLLEDRDYVSFNLKYSI